MAMTRQRLRAVQGNIAVSSTHAKASREIELKKRCSTLISPPCLEAFVTSSSESSHSYQCCLCRAMIDHTPRSLRCSHHVCSPCVKTHTQRGRRKRRAPSSFVFTCPLDNQTTPVIQRPATSDTSCHSRTPAPLSGTAMRAWPSTMAITDPRQRVGETRIVTNSDTHEHVECRVAGARTLPIGANQPTAGDHGDSAATQPGVDRAESLLAACNRPGVDKCLVSSEVERWFGRHDGRGACEFSGACGSCVSPDGELLYVADTNKYRVQVLRTSDGALLRSIALDGFFLPSFVCLSRDGTALFVSDAVRDAVVLISLDDDRIARCLGAGQVGRPRGVCLSPDGEWLFVADSSKHCVQVLRAADGAAVHSFGSHGDGAGEFDAPEGVCLSLDGKLLYVADCNNHRVQVLRASDGAHVVFLGSAAFFLFPLHIVALSDGRLLVADHRAVWVMCGDGGDSVGALGVLGALGIDGLRPRGVCVTSNDIVFAHDSFQFGVTCLV